MAADDDIRAIRARVEQAHALRGRREAERDAAQATLNRAAGELKTEFGVTTLEEARAMRTQLEGELSAQVKAISDELERV